MTLADRIVVMHDGIIEQIGTPMELFTNPANTFVASFIGSPPMNQMPATIVHSSTGLQAKVDDRFFNLPDGINVEDGQDVVVGIRPEHLSLDPQAGDSTISISLDLVETLGSEALLHASIGEHPLIIKTETKGNLEHLSGVSEVYAPSSLVKVFDSETGVVLNGSNA